MKKHKKIPKILCFGGGNAMPKAVLAGLKKYPVQITSVTSMVDSGASSRFFREEFNVLPPGDIKHHFINLAEAPKWKKELFRLRFGNEVFPGGHQGHSLGNAIIATLEHHLKDYNQVLDILHQFLEIKKHRVLPATITKTNVFAILENSQVIKGEDEIDLPRVHDGNLKIKKVYLRPKAKAYPPILEAINRANLIIIGPGDLYSSLIPCFLPEGIAKAIQDTFAKKVFICNSMQKFGETNDFSVLDFTNEIEKYLGGSLDYVIYNNFIPQKERIKKYKKENPQLLDVVKINEGLDSKKFIGTNLLVKTGPIIYDSGKLTKILLKS